MANPYLQSQADAITNQVNRNLQNNILPGIGSGAVAAGGYGGSRQGIAEGNAIGQTNQDLSNSLANLYGTNYQQDQQNALQQQQINNQFGLGLGGLGLQNQNQQNQFALGLGGLGLQNQSLQNQYALGLGNLGLTNQQQNYNFYTQNRGLDQSGAALGASLYNQGNTGYLSQGTGITGIGNTQQQAPWNVLGNAGNLFNQYTGLGGSTVQTATGSQLGGAVGGALAGAQIGKNLGLGNSTGQTDPNLNYGGYGTNLYGDGYGPV